MFTFCISPDADSGQGSGAAGDGGRCPWYIGWQPKPANPKPAQPEKKDRIFGVIPNYRTVERPGQVITPITAKQKFGLAVQDGFDPYAYFIAGAFAGVGQAQNDPRSWG